MHRFLPVFPPDLAGTPHGSMGLMQARPSLFALLCATSLVACLNGCTLRPVERTEEMAIDSSALGPELSQAQATAPFCLHLRYGNTFAVAYSHNRREAWVTDGSCASKGAPRVVEALRVNWKLDWYDTQHTRACMGSDRCAIEERNIIEGRNIGCASAAARVGNQTAFLSTDTARCS